MANDRSTSLAGTPPNPAGDARLLADLERLSKHTPGPWRAEGWEGVVVNAADGATLAMMPGAHVSLDECKANARLIAAAPTMLEALKAAVFGANHIDCVRAMQEVLPTIRAAIALAEGGAR